MMYQLASSMNWQLQLPEDQQRKLEQLKAQTESDKPLLPSALTSPNDPARPVL